MTHDRMIRYFEMQQDRRPRGRFFIPLADLYRVTGRLEAASALLEEGIGRCADSLSARVVLARVRRDQGRAADARDLAREVLDRDPSHREAPLLLALPDRVPAVEEEITADEVIAADEDITADEVIAAYEVITTAVESDTMTADVDAAEAAAPADGTPWTPPEESGPATAAPAPAPAADTGATPRFLTQTLAEIYLAQGHRQKALAILRRLLAEHPEREDVAREIATLEAVDATAETPVDATAAAVQDAARTAAPTTVFAGSPVAAAAPQDPNRARFEAWLDRQQDGPA
ncbi:MAG: tetratricopeptide repeat protein [bacterium]|nr:tetratricopeptide repeat protein [bacterium]